ncbi:MAG: PaaI family thioesterase [Spirochaetia bacterium]|nr:PaaI family thioesterase [Spirochaetia bacterium]
MSNDNGVTLFDQELRALKVPPEVAKNLPPPSFIDMEGKFEGYVTRKEITVSFPVLPRYCNPLGNMQGGFITAAFDNTFGPLSFVAARNPTTTIDLDTQYIRPIQPGDRLTVTAKVMLRGFSIIYMTAEAVNKAGKVIATATTNMLILKKPE